MSDRRWRSEAPDPPRVEWDEDEGTFTIHNVESKMNAVAVAQRALSDQRRVELLMDELEAYAYRVHARETVGRMTMGDAYPIESGVRDLLDEMRHYEYDDD